MVAAEPGVSYAPLYYQTLELAKSSWLKIKCGVFDALISLSKQSRLDIVWCINNIEKCEKSFCMTGPDVVIQSDSSVHALGGVCGTKKTGNAWSHMYNNYNINYKELKAAYVTLQCLASDKENIHIHIQMDNATAVTYVQTIDGRKPMLNQLAREIWQWAISKNIWLSASHLPGKFNREADKQSRKTYSN